MKYKIGEKVEIINCGTSAHIGKIGIITNIYRGLSPDVRLDDRNTCVASKKLRRVTETRGRKKETKKPIKLDFKAFKLLTELPKLPKETQMDRIEAKLDQLLKARLVWEK